MKLKPLNHTVMVRRDKATSGSIILVEAEELNTGTVVFADNTLDIEEGDRVLFGKYSGATISFEGESLLAVPFKDVLAKICQS